jgi:hypothetical protein
MSPSRGKGGKRKRSLSPASAKSPEAKKGKLDSLLSFLTPGKAKPDAEKKKKRLSFGAPVVHAFDAFSPPCRRRALYDNANMDASKMEKGLARLFAPCRRRASWLRVVCDCARGVRACVRACVRARACVRVRTGCVCVHVCMLPCSPACRWACVRLVGSCSRRRGAASN